MKNEFTSYFQRLGLSTTLQTRIQEIFDFYATLCREDIIHVFVTEHITEDGTRNFESLWLLSSNFVMEAKGFVSRDDFDMAELSTPICYWEMQKQDYDFKVATDKSRMSFRFRFPSDVGGQLKASRENCDALRDLIVKYFVPKMRR